MHFQVVRFRIWDRAARIMYQISDSGLSIAFLPGCYTPQIRVANEGLFRWDDQRISLR
jgi:hypothetical protein